MAGSRRTARKDAPPTIGSEAATDTSSGGADSNSSTVADKESRDSQKQSKKSSKGPGSAPAAVVTDGSHVSSSMHSTAKGPCAQAIADHPAAVVARDTQLMLLASEIADLKQLLKAKRPNLLTVLEQKQKDLTGLPLHAVRLHTARVEITYATNNLGGEAKAVRLKELYDQLHSIALGMGMGSLLSITAFALRAYCLTEIAQEVGEYRKLCISHLTDNISEVKRLLDLDRVSGIVHNAHLWLDPKLEAVIENKGAPRVDKVEGEDMVARLKSRLTYMEAVLKEEQNRLKVGVRGSREFK